MVRSRQRILARANTDAVLDLFHADRETTEKEICSCPQQRCFDHGGILFKNPFAVLKRCFVMVLLHEYLSSDVQRRPITWVCLNCCIHAFKRTGQIPFFEELILRLIDQLDRVPITSPADFDFNRPRAKRAGADHNQYENEGNHSHTQVLTCGQKIRQDRHQPRKALVKRISSSAACSTRVKTFLSMISSPLNASPVA